MLIPDPDFFPSWIPDPTKIGGKINIKKSVVLPFDNFLLLQIAEAGLDS
jgi:hypothetical protein